MLAIFTNKLLQGSHIFAQNEMEITKLELWLLTTNLSINR